VHRGDDPDVVLAASGDAAAFERLVLRYQDDVVTTTHYLLGNYEDAVDVAQEAFVKAYRGLGTFRGQAAFRTWLLTIATNCARSHRSRQRAKKRFAPIVRLSCADPAGEDRGPDLDIPDREPSRSPTGLLERKEVKEALERAIGELEEASRQVLVLRDISGESYEAIAAALDLPLGTVKSRVHRARLEVQARLRPFLEA
jgi:RNA polymerase sigma-70 factor (ECF subfamily)